MADLADRLFASLTPFVDAPSWCVALSGGLDSSVLLHALVSLKGRQTLPVLRAIHVHHGLQAAADAWPAHCQRLCDGLGVELAVRHVRVAQAASIEQSARDARYAAFAEALLPGEVLLTGQHRDDQAETLLLRLLRGAGVRGLAGMPVRRRLGVGELVRPLLNVSRAELLAYAQAYGLQWVEDPSNQQMQFSRNYLRHAVLPAITARWPQVRRSLARTAGHLAEARELLDELAQEDLALLSAPDEFSWLKLPSLNLPALKQLSPARQRNALQYWLASRTRLPDSDHWAGWCDLRDASVGASAVWRLTDGELHRGGECIYWLSGAWLVSLADPVLWNDPLETLRLPGNGSVSLNGNPPQQPLRIGYRQGGETLEIPGRGRRDLKRLLNERHVPPFVRSRLPLLFAGDRLLAVANLPGLSAGDLRLDWDVPTSEQGLA